MTENQNDNRNQQPGSKSNQPQDGSRKETNPNNPTAEVRDEENTEEENEEESHATVEKTGNQNTEKRNR